MWKIRTATAAIADELLKIADTVVVGVQQRQKVRRMIKEAQIQPYQQETQWSCSAACLKAVLEHHGIEVTEEQCIEAIGTLENKGAEVDMIAEGARKLGLEAFDYEFASLEQARILLEREMPIICDIQSFNHPGKGHYVVLNEITDNGVALMDPNTPGNQRLLTPDHMDARWWDYTMQAPHVLKEKWGVVVLPPDEVK